MRDTPAAFDPARLFAIVVSSGFEEEKQREIEGYIRPRYRSAPDRFRTTSSFAMPRSILSTIKSGRLLVLR